MQKRNIPISIPKRRLRILTLFAGQLLIYSDKDDFDARKSPEDTVSLEGVSVQKVFESFIFISNLELWQLRKVKHMNLTSPPLHTRFSLGGQKRRAGKQRSSVFGVVPAI